MSKYTTGEIAKLCGVSVRTVQYYDSRNILVPSELSEGGRRLYSEQDLKRMKIICFLRDAGISINNIGEFGYCEGADIVSNGYLDGTSIAIGLIFGTVGIVAAYWKYTRKDIHSA